MTNATLLAIAIVARRAAVEAATWCLSLTFAGAAICAAVMSCG